MSDRAEVGAASPAAGLPPLEDMVWIPGGTFLMGSDHHYPEESPAHEVTVDGFWMDRYTVTNREFRRFVETTGYVTFAEKAPRAEDYPGAKPEMLVAGSIVFKKPTQRVDLRNHYNWWDWMPGASWRHPRGPQSSLGGLARHPVVHVGFQDAEAYARWAGKALPTEAEWELAARGGLQGAEFCWGEEFAPRGKQMCNTWQGDFPIENLKLDGYEQIAPVGSFPPNGYGLHEMAGNVWEWTTDWFEPHPRWSRRAAPSSIHRGVSPRRARSGTPQGPDSTSGDEGRLVPVRAELLPPLPPGGSYGAAGRYLDRPSGLPLRRAAGAGAA